MTQFNSQFNMVIKAPSYHWQQAPSLDNELFFILIFYFYFIFYFLFLFLFIIFVLFFIFILVL